MGVRRTLTVLVVGVVVVAASGFATAPGGMGGPTMSVPDGAGYASGPFGDSGADISVDDRLEGPDDTVRAKFQAQSEGAANRIQQDVETRHAFGDVVTADVTRDEYEALQADDEIEASPVQRVSLAQSSTSPESSTSPVTISWDRPQQGSSVSGLVDLRIDVDAYFDRPERVTWSVDGGTQRSTDRYPWTTIYGASWDTTGVEDGTYQLTAHAVMSSGETVTRTIEVTVDNGGRSGNEAPSISWQSPSDGSQVEGETMLSIAADDPDGTLEDVSWTVDDGLARSAAANDAGNWEATWDASEADPGTHHLTATALDDSGTTSTATISVEVSGGENQPPEVSWQSPTNGETVAGETHIAIGTNDPDGNVEEVRWRVDDGAEQQANFDWTAGAWIATWDATSAEAGSHQLTAIAVDEDGATSQATTTIDVGGGDSGSGQGPSVSWRSPTDGETIEGETTIEIDASDQNGSVEAVEWQVDGGAGQQATYDSSAGAWTATFDASQLSSGTHELRAGAVDDDQTGSAAIITVEVGGDSTGGPTVSWRSPTNGAPIRGETGLQIAASDGSGSVEEVNWYVDGGTAQAATSAGDGTWEATLDASELSTGVHQLTAVAVDDQGQERETTIEVEVVEQPQAPDVTWESPTGGEAVNGTVPIEISATDPDGTIQEVRWAAENITTGQATRDGNTWTGELDVSQAVSGEYRIMAAAVDDDNLIGNSTITVDIDSQNRKPEVSWISPSDGESLKGEVEIQIDASNPDGSIEQVGFGVPDVGYEPASYNQDTGYWEASFPASQLDDGNYTFEARTVDDQGAEASSQIDVSVDGSNEPPTVELETPLDGETVSGEVDVRFEASDPDGNLDMIAWTTNEGQFKEPTDDGGSVWVDTLDTTELSDGKHVLLAGAQDSQGAYATDKITIEVDNGASGGASEPTVSWNWPEDGATLAPHEVPIQISASAEGDSIASVRWQVEGEPLRSAEYNENTGYWEATWDAQLTGTGTHELRAGVQTESGTTTFTSVTVTVTGDGEESSGPDAPASTDQPSSSIPYGVQAVYGEAGGEPSGGDGVNVAILDSGVASDHPDLRDSVSRCQDMVGTGNCQDELGHGTHVAGVVAADGSNGLYGVAPETNVHAYKVVDDETGYADDVAAAIADAAESGVDILVLSVRSEARGSLVDHAIDKYSDELLVVAAAGNQGPETGTIVPPAASPDAVAVGALDSNGEVVESSSRGITASSFCEECADRLELVAPGQGIVSTWPGGGYNQLSGTSVAAPHVAGVAAKLWASGQADANGDGTVTPDEVRRVLRENARNLEGNGDYDPATGTGIPVVPG